MDRFYSTIGIEYTYLWPRKEPGNNELYRAQACGNNIIADFYDRSREKISVALDEGAVEIRSPVFKSMAEIKTFQTKMETIVGRYGLVTHRDDCYSGGGHIHSGIKSAILKNPHHLLLFLTNLFRDVVNRPYLNWIFNEWCNVKSAESFVGYKEKPSLMFPDAGTFYDILFNSRFKIPAYLTSLEIIRYFNCFKGFACRLDPATEGSRGKKVTVEFRFFDAKRNFDETRLQVEFVNRYLKWIDRMTQKGIVLKAEVKTRAQIKKFAAYGRAIDDFRDWLEDSLDLSYLDYKYFVDLNYRKRRGQGLLC